MNSLLQFAVEYSYSYSSSSSDVATAGAVAGILGIMMLPAIIVGIVMLISMWKLYAKAGKPGWAAIVPIYNTWVMAEIGGKPGWWCFLCMIPFAGPFIAIYLMYLFVKAYGKGVGFFLGCLFVSIVFYPMLAFGKSQYVGGGAAVPPVPGGAPAPTAAPAPTPADPWTEGTDTTTPAAEATPAPEAPVADAPAADAGQPTDPTQQPMA